jgi:hypothetical protein
MKTTTAQNHLDRLKKMMYCIFCSARVRKYQFITLINELSCIWNDSTLEKCPRWVNERLKEYFEHLVIEMFSYLKYAYKGSDGNIVINFSDLSPRDKQLVNSQDPSVEFGFFWLERIATREDCIDGGIRIIKEFRITDKRYGGISESTLRALYPKD